MAGKRKGMVWQARAKASRQSAYAITAREIHSGTSKPKADPQQVPRRILAQALRAVKLAINQRSSGQAHAAIEHAFRLLGPPDKVALDTPLASVPGLNLRLVNALEGERLLTVADILACSRARLLLIENFGRKSIEELETVLQRHGFTRPVTPSTLISELPGLDPAVAASLEGERFFAVQDLLRSSPAEWMLCPRIAATQVQHIQAALQAAGLITEEGKATPCT